MIRTRPASEGGSEVQCHIDTYLAAAAYFMLGGESWAANMMVLGLPYAPQEGRLPDLPPSLSLSLSLSLPLSL